MTMRGLFVARATSMDLRMELINASEEKGFTMPDVPMMEIPPSIPKRGLKVRFAISSPLGTEMVTTIGLGCLDMPIFSRQRLTLSSIILRGVALMAGEPNSRPRPGIVTMPMPSPPQTMIS